MLCALDRCALTVSGILLLLGIRLNEHHSFMVVGVDL
jgi:hypothetical protein